MKILLQQFAQELTHHTSCFQVKLAFRPNDQEDEDSEASEDAPAGIPLRLHQKFQDFFDLQKAEQLPSHRATNHAIELKPGTEPPYMHMYNMSPAELKALEEYLDEALAKGWI